MATPPPDLRTIVLNAIALTANTKVESLDPGVALEELGLDSLDFSTILIDVEDSIGVEVPIEVLDRLAEISTVGDVLDLLGGWHPEAESDAGPSAEVVVIGDA